MNGRGALLAMMVLAFGSPAEAAAPLDPSKLAAIAPGPDARAPLDQMFLDEHGRAVTLRQLSGGKPIVLAPVQHSCRNLCGLTLEALRQTIAGQSFRPGRDFALVAFGIDPRETPAQASASVGKLGNGNASAVVGGASAIAAVTTALGYRYSWMAASRQYAHLSAFAVLAPDGRLVTWIRGLGAPPAGLHAALLRARSGAPVQAVEPIRLLCFHFDPVTGRYSLAVTELLRWAAAASVGTLAIGVAVALARGRRRGRTT